MNFVFPPVTCVEFVSTVIVPVTTFGASPRSAWNVAAFAVTLYGLTAFSVMRRVGVDRLDVSDQRHRVALVRVGEEPVPGATFAVKPEGA
jgi:hypothetical protein